MSETYPKATTLAELQFAFDQQPLEPGDPRWIDLSKGRGSDTIAGLRTAIGRFDASKSRYACELLAGHRGCGKTTALRRLQHDLQDRFTSVLLTASESLVGDYDYTDLLLELVEDLVAFFSNDIETPLNNALVKDIDDWFAEVTRSEITKQVAEIGVESEANASSGFSVFGVGAKFLARLRASMVGSREVRDVVRRQLRTRSYELIERVNLLLDDARAKLMTADRPTDLLLIFDNLRVAPEVGRKLYVEHADKLKSLHAHMIYTAPIGSVLAPHNIGRFLRQHMLPVVRTCDRGGKEHRNGIEVLIHVIRERAEADILFSRGVTRTLAKMSGGSLTDLNRLVEYASLIAEINGKDRITPSIADQAIARLRNDFQRALFPGTAYYPLLAQVHTNHTDPFVEGDSIDEEQIEAYRERFRDMLFNGSVLEYDGGDSWYDVHPAVKDLDGFKQAIERL